MPINQWGTRAFHRCPPPRLSLSGKSQQDVSKPPLVITTRFFPIPRTFTQTPPKTEALTQRPAGSAPRSSFEAPPSHTVNVNRCHEGPGTMTETGDREETPTGISVLFSHTRRCFRSVQPIMTLLSHYDGQTRTRWAGRENMAKNKQRKQGKS